MTHKHLYISLIDLSAKRLLTSGESVLDTGHQGIEETQLLRAYDIARHSKSPAHISSHLILKANLLV